MWCKLRLTYYGLEAVIIDGLYMVSNIRLYQIHCRLYEIFSHTCGHFSYFKLTEAIRQQGDSIFIDLLNNVRVRAISGIDNALIS